MTHVPPNTSNKCNVFSSFSFYIVWVSRLFQVEIQLESCLQFSDKPYQHPSPFKLKVGLRGHDVRMDDDAIPAAGCSLFLGTTKVTHASTSTRRGAGLELATPCAACCVPTGRDPPTHRSGLAHYSGISFHAAWPDVASIGSNGRVRAASRKRTATPAAAGVACQRRGTFILQKVVYMLYCTVELVVVASYFYFTKSCIHVVLY